MSGWEIPGRFAVEVAVKLHGFNSVKNEAAHRLQQKKSSRASIVKVNSRLVPEEFVHGMGNASLCKWKCNGCEYEFTIQSQTGKESRDKERICLFSRVIQRKL